jgi:hypothetical protein
MAALLVGPLPSVAGTAILAVQQTSKDGRSLGIPGSVVDSDADPSRRYSYAVHA